MIKGFYAAVTSMIANLNRQENLSHNIANLETPGFKQVLSSLDEYIQVAAQRPAQKGQDPLAEAFIDLPFLPFDKSPTSLGELGLGVESAPPMTDFKQGPLTMSGQALDIAIQGEGFFRVLTPDGERYTRDGRFARDSEGQLVTIDGYAVLDQNGNPINLPDGIPSISDDGTISVENTVVGQIGMAAFEEPEAELARDRNNLFSAAAEPTGEELGSMHQGYLEGANANLAELMTQMVAVGRAYEAAQQLVQVQDELLGRTISTLGRL